MSAPVVAELERIRTRDGGTLRPQAVVEEARDASSPLHPHFEWDDGEAAEKWRLEQARRLIRVVKVELVTENSAPIVVRNYVSLPSDRGDAGYRTITEVLNDDTAAAEALRNLAADVERLMAKYNAWASLRPALAKMVDAVRGVRLGREEPPEPRAGH